MAEEVGWVSLSKSISFKEGPFVISNSNNNRELWFIFVKFKGSSVPLSLKNSLAQLCLKQKKRSAYNNSKKEITAVCDWLNGLVKNGKIIENNGEWLVK